MQKTFNKTEDNKLEVVETIPQEIIPEKQETKQYDISFLKEQKIRIYEDYDNTVAKHATELATRQAEKDEIDQLLVEADKLGITEAEEQVIPEEQEEITEELPE
jgi:hypothetical protein